MLEITEQSRNSHSFNDTRDPSEQNGFKKIYYSPLSFQIKIEQQSEQARILPNQEVIWIKLLLKTHEEMELKIQLSCDNDLFFNFVCRIDESRFETIKYKQHLKIQFSEFANIIIKNLDKAIKQPHLFNLSFTIFSEMEGKLNLTQRSEFKNYEILCFDFRRASEYFIRQSISFRYVSMRKQIEDITRKLSMIDQTIKSKNPSLLLQIRKKMPAGYLKK